MKCGRYLQDGNGYFCKPMILLSITAIEMLFWDALLMENYPSNLPRSLIVKTKIRKQIRYEIGLECTSSAPDTKMLLWLQEYSVINANRVKRGLTDYSAMSPSVIMKKKQHYI